MNSIREISDLIEPALEALGFELVQTRLMGGARRTLQVMVERVDRRSVSVDDCARASNAIGAILDVEDPVQGSYVLEVSSPGIDRPLVRPGDFERFSGFEARLETEEAVAGRKRFRGRLRGLDGGDVRIALPEGELRVPLALLRRAKLVLTDELIAATEAGRGSAPPPSE